MLFVQTTYEKSNETLRTFMQKHPQMDQFLKKVAAHANAKLPPDHHIHLHAHKLRHTSVKKVHDKRGPLEAKKFSGHRSFKQLERYATSTTPEHEDMVDGLFS